MHDTDNELRREALRLAELGYAIFPLSPSSKLPQAGSHGFNDATTSIAQVQKWWDDFPTANIGIRTDGLIVVDVDLLGKESDNPRPNPFLSDAPDLAVKMAAAPTQLT